MKSISLREIIKDSSYHHLYKYNITIVKVRIQKEEMRMEFS